MPSKPSVKRLPKLSLHKPTGQGYVRLGGAFHYMGRYDDPMTHEKAMRFIAEWIANGYRVRVDPAELTVNELAAAYLKHADEYYGPNSRALERVRNALKPLVAMYGTSKAKDFGPVALRTIANYWIGEGLCRSTINAQVSRLKRMFKWGVAQEMIPPDLHTALSCVEGLRQGRSPARESRIIGPVLDAHVDAIRPYVSRAVWGLVEMQRFTGARSGEILGLRRCDLDTSGPVWIARIQEHKTAHHGKERVLCFGPQAQAVLREFFPGKGPTDCLFSPKDAFRERAEAAETHRRPSQAPTPRETDRTLRDQYDSASYGRAIARAVKDCNEDREKNGLPPIPHWHPHQLRHSFATAVRRQYGLEAAQVALGHSDARVTEIYAELDHAKAIEVARKVG